jgi:CheY-like chemotaxis protein
VLQRGIGVLQILLAEDSPGDVFLVQQALAEHEIIHTLHVVRDGDEALMFLAGMGEQNELPCLDLLLLDLNLPKVDGTQVLREFRKHPACMETPVIVITSSDAPKDRRRIELLGANAYFRKPSDLDEYMTLGAIIKEVVHKSTP